MKTRTKSRETALQILYKADVSAPESDDFSVEMEDLAPGTESRRFCETLVSGVLARRDEIDRVIDGSSEKWRVDRMSVVDRNILRLAVFELLHCPDTPYRVVIDEAVELAKRFGTEESGPFINGILDRVHRDASPGAAG